MVSRNRGYPDDFRSFLVVGVRGCVEKWSQRVLPRAAAT